MSLDRADSVSPDNSPHQYKIANSMLRTYNDANSNESSDNDENVANLRSFPVDIRALELSWIINDEN